jgi:hypothetical protein
MTRGNLRRLYIAIGFSVAVCIGVVFVALRYFP